MNIGNAHISLNVADVDASFRVLRNSLRYDRDQAAPPLGGPDTHRAAERATPKKA
jgi:hypothetical protein